MKLRALLVGLIVALAPSLVCAAGDSAPWQGHAPQPPGQPALVQGAPAPQQRADPAQQALVQMVGEAQSREAQALVQVYALRAQLADMKVKLDAETKRADEAEASTGAAAAK